LKNYPVTRLGGSADPATDIVKSSHPLLKTMRCRFAKRRRDQLLKVQNFSGFSRFDSGKGLSGNGAG
jgi:hypothetical protein